MKGILIQETIIIKYMDSENTRMFLIQITYFNTLSMYLESEMVENKFLFTIPFNGYD